MQMLSPSITESRCLLLLDLQQNSGVLDLKGLENVYKYLMQMA
jgi:hypothetical protein